MANMKCPKCSNKLTKFDGFYEIDERCVPTKPLRQEPHHRKSSKKPIHYLTFLVCETCGHRYHTIYPSDELHDDRPGWFQEIELLHSAVKDATVNYKRALRRAGDMARKAIKDGRHV